MPSSSSRAAWCHRRVSALLPLLVALACSIPTGEPPIPAPPPTEPSDPQPGLAPVPLAELPANARFKTLGFTGAVHRVEGKVESEVRLPVPAEALQRLLPGTIRAFRFDQPSSIWKELEATTLDEQSLTVTLTEPEPGLYATFGWSRDPVLNAVQRWTVDVANGRRPTAPPAATVEDLRNRIGNLDPKLRPAAVRDWVVWELTLQLTTCEAFDEPGCDPACRAASGQKLNQCPDICTDDCCSCETFDFTERAVIPRVVLDRLQPCPIDKSGCRLCPGGLSCSDHPPIVAIAPDLDTLDYSVLDRRLAEVVGAMDLRDHLHTAVEQTVGHEYPVPPPWP